MQRILAILLSIVVIVGAVVFLVSRRGSEEGHAKLRFARVYTEAQGVVDPATLGAAWPEDNQIQTLRREWAALGAADSTLMDQLALSSIYPVSRGPLRLTNLTELGPGRALSLEARLKWGERLLDHPTWRVGVMRHFPVAAAVLNAPEKSLLEYLAGEGAKTPPTESRLTAAIKVPAGSLAPTLEALASIGWVHRIADGDSTRFAVADPAIAHNGAFQYLTVTADDGKRTDVVSFAAALERMGDAIQEGRVRVSGPCAQTGRRIYVELMDGRLKTGKPGEAWAVQFKNPGLSNGLFVSEKAFQAWQRAHPQAEVMDQGRIPGFFHKLLAGS